MEKFWPINKQTSNAPFLNILLGSSVEPGFSQSLSLHKMKVTFTE